MFLQLANGGGIPCSAGQFQASLHVRESGRLLAASQSFLLSGWGIDQPDRIGASPEEMVDGEKLREAAPRAG